MITALLKLAGQRLEVAVNTQLITNDNTWKWWIETRMNESIADYTKDITTPINLIVSSDDPAITEEMTRKETIPNLPKKAKVTLTSGIGHLMPIEDPVWLARLIRQLTL